MLCQGLYNNNLQNVEKDMRLIILMVLQQYLYLEYNCSIVVLKTEFPKQK